jgi:alkylated DNA repair dioxygenase AlkB
MNAPVTYHPTFLSIQYRIYLRLMEDLAWVKHTDAPRYEYHCNDLGVSYSYGVEQYRRTYLNQTWTPTILNVRESVETITGHQFDMCFANRYDTASDSLGWHSDDSPMLDTTVPIAIVSLGNPLLGGPRQIQFREIDRKEKETLTLDFGSLCVMAPGMQQTHQHRIPKAGFVASPRISLTFRGLKK